MDTNYLLQREQVSLMMADRAASPEARIAHNGLALAYGALLAVGKFPHRRFEAIAAADRDRGEHPDRGAAQA